jgi:hypothetical protein
VGGGFSSFNCPVIFFQDLQFRLEEKEFEYIGDDFNIKANITSFSLEERTVQVILQCESVHYNGKRYDVVKQEQWNLTIPPGDSKSFHFHGFSHI